MLHWQHEQDDSTQSSVAKTRCFLQSKPPLYCFQLAVLCET